MSHPSQCEMIRILTYIGQWFSDWYAIFVRELRHIFSDSGVLIIFFLAGLAYPALYGIIYSNGTLDDMPVAVVDESGSRTGRKFLRKLDATREVNVSRPCMNMAEAERLMQQREVHGIVLIPSDFEERLASGQQAGVSSICLCGHEQFHILQESDYGGEYGDAGRDARHTGGQAF